MTKFKANTKSGNKKKGGSNKKNHNNNHIPKRKYNRSLSKSITLFKNNKTYHWCPGPGHEGKGMWTIHCPGNCTSKPTQPPKNNNKPAILNCHALVNALKQKDMADNEIHSKVEAILAVLKS